MKKIPVKTNPTPHHGTSVAAKVHRGNGPLSVEMLARVDGYWRAANYLCVGQLYLWANPLLREPLKAAHIKPRFLGHWGTDPGQIFAITALARSGKWWHA